MLKVSRFPHFSMDPPKICLSKGLCKSPRGVCRSLHNLSLLNLKLKRLRFLKTSRTHVSRNWKVCCSRRSRKNRLRLLITQESNQRTESIKFWPARPTRSRIAAMQSQHCVKWSTRRKQTTTCSLCSSRGSQVPSPLLPCKIRTLWFHHLSCKEVNAPQSQKLAFAANGKLWTPLVSAISSCNSYNVSDLRLTVCVLF